jgi:hypothetical protein
VVQFSPGADIDRDARAQRRTRKDQGPCPDARARRDRHHRRMDDFTPVHITVHVDSPDPLRGTLSEPGQLDREFIGWTGLATLMDTIVRRHGTAETSA